ncbi:MAG: cobalamin-dependent protein [Planctomycetota bacterium]|nr:cobalamin-dependent protein [Planctomycetota bacterium]
MASTKFTFTLLRTSARGFGAVAASRVTVDPSDGVKVTGDYAMWHAHYETLILELAAALDDGNKEQFADKVEWTRDALNARGLASDVLKTALEELCVVLKDSLPSQAWTPLVPFFDAASKRLDQQPASSEDDLDGTGDLDVLARDFLSTLEGGHSAKAVALVVDAIRKDKISISDALVGVLPRALEYIGRQWHLGAATVAEEHFATQTAGRLLEQIMLMAPEPVANGHTAVMAMVEGDNHDIGVRIVAAFFELDGWKTICLGANAPANDLANITQHFEADLVLIGATLNTQREAVRRCIKTVREVCPNQAIIVGGAAFTNLEGCAEDLGANAQALNPEHALRLGREIVAG